MRTASVISALALAACAGAAGLPWAKSYASAVASAKSAKKVVMVDFTASWCTNCHKLDRTTYVDPQVVSLLSRSVAVKVDTDKEPAVAKKFKVSALPVILFIGSNGRELGRINGYVDAKQFVAQASQILRKK